MASENVLELLAVLVIIAVVFLIAYRYVSGYETKRQNATQTVDNNLAKMLNEYELRGGITIRFSLVNQTLNEKVSVANATKGKIIVAPIEAEFTKSAYIVIGDGSAKLILDGKEYNYECTTSELGKNIKMMSCGIKDVRFKDAIVSSVISGVIAEDDGKFTGFVSFNLKG